MLRFNVTDNQTRREIFETDDLAEAIQFGRNHAYDNGVQVAIFDGWRDRPDFAVRMIWPDGQVEVG